MGLFNEDDFMPETVPMLAGGVTRSEISGIYPAAYPFERTESKLKVKFRQLKSQYEICAARFQSSGQGDPENFVAFEAGGVEVVHFVLFLIYKEAPDYAGTRNADATCVGSEGGEVSLR